MIVSDMFYVLGVCSCFVYVGGRHTVPSSEYVIKCARENINVVFLIHTYTLLLNSIIYISVCFHLECSKLWTIVLSIF